MSEWKVNQALTQSFVSIGIPNVNVAYEAREFTPPANNTIWYSLNNLPGGRDPQTLGDAGEDRLVGVYQIDVYAPKGQGVRPVLEAAGALTAYYKAGRRFTTDGQTVIIRRAEASPARPDGVRLVVSVSVYYQSDVQR